MNQSPSGSPGSTSLFSFKSLRRIVIGVVLLILFVWSNSRTAKCVHDRALSGFVLVEQSKQALETAEKATLPIEKETNAPLDVKFEGLVLNLRNARVNHNAASTNWNEQVRKFKDRAASGDAAHDRWWFW